MNAQPSGPAERFIAHKDHLSKGEQTGLTKILLPCWYSLDTPRAQDLDVWSSQMDQALTDVFFQWDTHKSIPKQPLLLPLTFEEKVFEVGILLRDIPNSANPESKPGAKVYVLPCLDGKRIRIALYTMYEGRGDKIQDVRNVCFNMKWDPVNSCIEAMMGVANAEFARLERYNQQMSIYAARQWVKEFATSHKRGKRVGSYPVPIPVSSDLGTLVCELLIPCEIVVDAQV